ncbi:sister chromatid cohesion protein PDS5 homolog D-like [Bidens hawaiensis]|uniref:sister chromatid cohesion protein PDS5 homolog D-like n=1 Tax=Bidens hawaiensis TaxID=980011 RepID=UPI0040490D92
MASTDVELEQQLKDAGKQLSHPSNSVRLLPALDELEKLLLKVDQAPKKSILDALKPSMSALIHSRKHSDIDVRVSVASCISQITRITAPDAPYSDDQMRDVFQLIVSSFEDLADRSSRSYNKRASILEIVSKVRSCVIMLDLDCDELILKMFEHFLKSVRDYHLGSVYSSMENIMVSLIAESEEISVDMLKPLLASVKKHREGVLPVAHKLGKGVFLKSADKLKPYVMRALTSLGESLDMYHKVVAAVCEGTTADFDSNDDNDDNDDNDAELQPANECKLKKGSPKSVVSNGVIVTAKEKTSADQALKKLEEDKSQELIKKVDGNDIDADKLLKENSQTEKVFINIEKEVDITRISAEKRTEKKSEDDEASDVKPLERSKCKSTKQSGEKLKQSGKKLETPVKKVEKSKIALEDFTESDVEPLKLSARKSTPKKKDDGKKHADSKNVAGKDCAKSLLGVYEMDVSPKLLVKENDSDCKQLKPPSRKRTSKKKDDGEKHGNSKNVAGKAKTVTREGNLTESPVTSAKRKHSTDIDEVSNAIKYDESLVGKKVKVWWPEDKMYYEGVVSEFYPAKKKHKVSYVDDGDEEKLNLRTQKWEILEEFSVRDYTEQNTKEIAEDNNVEAATTEKDKDTKKTSGNLCDAAATTSKEAAKSRKSSKKTVNESKGKTPPSSSKSDPNGEKTEYDKENLRLEDKRLRLRLEAEKLRIEAEKERSKIRQEDERLRLEGERLRLEAEKMKLSKKESDDRIMMMDVSAMPEMQRLYFEKLQREIIMRCNHA